MKRSISSHQKEKMSFKFQSFLSDSHLNSAREKSRIQRSQIRQTKLSYGHLEPRQLLAGIVAVDLGALGGTPSTLANFQGADPNLGASTTFVRDNTSVNFSAGALDRTYGGLTFSTPGPNSGNGFQTSNSNSYTADVPVLDSYVFSTTNQPNNGELTLDISGFAARPAGQTITLTAFGVGDQVGQQTEFTSTFGFGSSSQETFYGINNNGSGAIPFVQFTFTTDGITDQLTLAANGASAGSVFIPVNGISLSVTDTAVDLLPGAVPVITEFLASNANSIDDDNGNSTDFIEIFNAGDTAVNLAGYSLTDDPNQPQRYVFSNTILGAGQYLVVFAGDDTDPTTGSDLFTGFGLRSSGEYLGFFDNNGNLVNEFGANGADFPEQFTDVSFGLLNDGNFDTSSFFATPTPGFANVNPIEGVTSRVNSSVVPGFFEDAISVQLTTDTVGAAIFYTTDGSTPTASNGTLYDPGNPISISSTTNLRAVSVLNNYLSGFDRTYSYLFVDDILDQTAATTEAAGFPDEDNRPNGGLLDYGFDPEVLDIEGREAVGNALLSLPSIAITTDVENLFDPNTGIYVNALESGRAYERPASVELINPDGTEGFQVNAGLRIRGGFSRRDTNPKHSFRLLFRSEYGDSELNYPLHGADNVDTFQNLDLRTAQNYSYNLEGDPTNNFIAEVISRQNQGLNGDLTTQSTYAHLYLNGQYWGLYQTQERAEADFAASYLGGDADDYDVLAPDAGIGNSRFIQATDGNTDAYFRLFDQAAALAPDNSTPAFVDNEAYYRAQGLNLDGTRNPDFEVLLDVDNLINYITEIQYSGNFDSGITQFGGNDSLNNFQAIRNRNGDEGFRFFVHDAEHSLRSLDTDRTIPLNDPEFDNARSFNPITLHQRLLVNAEYRSAFADSIQEKFFNDGIYTTENIIARWDAEADKIRTAIIAESARWGDSHPSRTNNPILQADFNNAINQVRDNILAQRNEVYLEQLRNVIVQLRDGNGNFTINVDAPLFPEFDAPVFEINGVEQFGGEIASGDVLTINSSEAVYFTTDGSDPRLVGGGINPNAILYNSTTTTTSVFGLGSEWRFLDDGSDQGTAWRLPSFDDSGFESGFSELGFGDDPTTTTDRFDSNGDQVITTYFRRTFDVTESFDTATLELFYDDGAAVYLNGNLVDTVNLNGPINFQTLAASPIVDGATTFLDVSDFLVLGTNTLAIEIHQVSTTSSDLSFNAALTTSAENSNIAALPLTTSTNIQARSFSNGEFSGLVNATFAIPGDQSELRISELHFNPAAPTLDEIAAGFDDNDDFEFIEIFNPNATDSINLSGAQLFDGVSFNFGDVDLLPGERAVIVEDIDAFMVRYGDSDVTILGQYSGGLSNSGEEVILLDSSGEEVTSIDYSDSDPLLFAADGVGFSLVLDDLDDPSSLRVSTELGGTPGSASGESLGVVINEVLANSDAGQLDAIELFNPTTSAINVGGLFLSDDSGALLQYQIPLGTVISAGGYLVFDETNFNSAPLTGGNFALSSLGEAVFLSRVSGGIVSLEDSVEFGATFSGESLGRLPDGSGRLTRLASTSFGSANGEAQVGPLVISEINYHPGDPSAAALAIDPTLTDNDLEFIEIANPTSESFDLTNFRIRGEADFNFVAGTTLAAGQAIVVVTFDPANPLNANRLAAFEANYGLSGDVTIVGGLSESLSNSSGRISLQQQDAPNPLGEVAYVAIDEVFYTDDAPFPDAADGSGQSLQRDDFSVSGNIATNWIAVAPTPGELESEFLLGDVNRDGVVNFFDISPFIAVLQAQDFQAEADIDGDGDVDFFDINPFIDLLGAQS